MFCKLKQLACYKYVKTYNCIYIGIQETYDFGSIQNPHFELVVQWVNQVVYQVANYFKLHVDKHLSL